MSLIGRGRRWGGRLIEAGRLLTFSAFRMGAYSRWALIRGWALIRINTVFYNIRDKKSMVPALIFRKNKTLKVQYFNTSL